MVYIWNVNMLKPTDTPFHERINCWYLRSNILYLGYNMHVTVDKVFVDYSVDLYLKKQTKLDIWNIELSRYLFRR